MERLIKYYEITIEDKETLLDMQIIKVYDNMNILKTTKRK